MNRLWLVLIIALILVIAIAVRTGDNNQDKISEPTSVDIQNTPNRIVSLSPNITEILFAMGLGEKVVAVSADSDYPPEAANKEQVGTFWSPNTEAVITARPDLVITLAFEQQRAVAETLGRLNYPVLTLKMRKTEDLATAIEKIGLATGYKREADELIENISKQLENLKTKLHSINKAKVLWVVQAEPLRVAGRNTFVNELIELAGGENAIGPTIQQYPLIGTEELLSCEPRIIIQAAMAKGDIARQQQAAETFWSKWPALPAVKNNKIYVVEPDTVLRLGPRLPQGTELIARCLHPDVFGQDSGAGKNSGE